MEFVTYLIIIITTIVSLYYMSSVDKIMNMTFNAYQVWHLKKIYRLFTYGLIHSGFTHLLFNMITLYFFGPVVESYLSFFFGRSLGVLIYVFLYVSALPISCIVDIFKYRDSPYYNALGASGAISAILFAAIGFEPSMEIYVMFIPIGIKAPIFAILYLIYCWYMGKRNIDNIGHYAHLNGAIYGLIFAFCIKAMFPYVFS